MDCDLGESGSDFAGSRRIRDGSSRTGERRHECVVVRWWVADCGGAACADKKEAREGWRRVHEKRGDWCEKKEHGRV